MNYTSKATPHSNTGSNRQEPNVKGIASHLDYITFCGVGDIKEILDATYSVFGVVYDFAGAAPATRGCYYDTVLRSAISIELAYCISTREDGKSKFRLNIPGQPLRHVRPHELHKLLRLFALRGYNCTRFDWAVDDYDRLLSIDDVKNCCENDDYSGARSYRFYSQKRQANTEVGRTIYLGSFQSSKIVRIYDKAVESKGETNSIRYEVQWRHDYSAEAFRQYTSSSDLQAVTQMLNNLAIGAVSFINRENQVLSRCEVCEFWSEFVMRVGAACKMSVRRLQPMLSAKKRWIEKQVVATIFLITKCMGWDETFNWLERNVREKSYDVPSSVSAFIATWFARANVENCEFADMQVIQSWDL